MTYEFTEANTSRTAQLNEYTLHYNDTETDGETIIMIHGSGPGASGWSNFFRNVGPLAHAGYRVILMDCPGWNKSSPVINKGSRSDLNATALKALLDHLGIERPHIIGNSMGAHSTVAFALANPGRYGKLVLMGGGTGGASLFTPQPTEGIKRIAALYRDPSIENLKAMMDVFVYDPSSITEELHLARLNAMLANRQHLENFVQSSKENPRQFPDYSYRLNEISQPTLIIWGRDDRFVPLDIGLRVLASLPNAQLHVFSKCGHWAQWEHAESFNRLVLDFLQH